MKNNLFKKSMSVFLAVLMIMSCWVWTPGIAEHNHAEAVASNVRGVPAIRGSHYAGTTAAYGTPVFDGNLDRWFKFHNKGSDYVQIYYPSNIYLDKSETLQSAGYFFNVDWAFGNSSDYRILIGAPALGDNSAYSGYPDKYYTMTNCFTGYGFDSSVPSGGAQKVYNTSTGGTDYDLRIVGYGHSTQGSDGFNYDGTRHDKYVLYRSYSGNPNTATIYLLGTPNGEYDKKEYNTTGASLGSYGFQQNYTSRNGWKENNNSMFKQKSYDQANDGCSSYYEGQYAEMQWFVTVYDKSALNTVITNANNLLTQKGKYTTASLNNLQNVLNANKGVLTTRATNQKSINDAKDNIQAAIDNLVEFGVAFDNLFNFNEFTIGGNLTVNERTDKGFTVTSTAADGNTGFSKAIPVVPGKTYILSADVGITAVSGGYDMYIHTLDANQAGETTAVPDTSNGAHREGDVYISLTGQTTNSTPYIRFTAGSNTKFVKIRFDANAIGNKLTVNNIRLLNETDYEGVSYVPTKMFKNNASLGTSFTVPTRTGYTFNRWYADNDVDGMYDSGEEVTDANGNIVSALSTYKINQNWILHSDWTEHKYNIAFNANGGSGSTAGISNVLYSADTKLTANGFSRTGYTFTGWNTKADGTGTAYANGATVSKLTATNGATVTLYAQWSVNKHTVTFEKIDGTTTSAQYNYGTAASAITKPANTATKDNGDTHTVYSWPEISTVTGNVTYEEIATTNAHNYGDWVITVHSNCEAEGSKYRLCQTCGHREDAVVEKTPHTPVHVDANPATCTADGNIEYWYCSECSKMFSDAECKNEIASVVDPQKGHKEVTIPAVEATCTDTGLTEGKKCSVCGVVTVAQTETPKLAHTEEIIPAVESTCTATGLTEGKKCSVCGTITVAQQTTNKKDHTMGTWTQTLAPTCITDGQEQSKCANCDYIETRTVPATGKHIYGGWTYTNGSSEHTGKCIADSNCNATTSETHSFTEDVKPKEGSNSFHDYKCTVCDARGAVLNGTTPMAGVGEDCSYNNCEKIENNHSYHNVICKCGREKQAEHDIEILNVIKTPTCTEKGSQEEHCKICDYTFTRELPMLDHSYTGDYKWNNYSDKPKTHSQLCVNGCNEYGNETECEFEITDTTASSCTDQGSTTYTCKVCKNSYTVYAQILGHNFTEFEAKTATCTEDGNKAYKYCETCKKYFAADAETNAQGGEDDNSSFVIGKLGHEYEENFTVDKKASCTEVGSKSKHCSRCDDKTEVTEIPVREHTVVDVDIQTDATCLTDGVMNQKCSNTETDEYEACKYTTTRVIPAKGHTFGETVEAKTETCTEDGNKAYKQCSACDLYFAENAGKDSEDGKEDTTSFVISKLGHEYEENFTVDKKASCTEAGSKSKHCSRCGDKTEVTEIPVREHTVVDVDIQKDATCLTDGVMNQKCSNTETDEYEACEYTTTRVIPAKGHTFGETVEAKTATCTEDGNKAYKYCETCKKYFAADAETNAQGGEDDNSSFVISKLDHKMELTSAQVDPTCTATGTEAIYTCANGCGRKSGGKEIPALGHIWTVSYSFADDGSSCTAERVCSRDESHVETATATINSEVTIQATCTEMGTTTYTATFEGIGWADPQTKDLVDVPALGHSYSSLVTKRPELVNGTWTKGEYTYTCSRCDDSYTEEVERAVYTEFEKAVADLEALKTNENLTADAEHEITVALGLADTLAENLVTSEQITVDEMVEKLKKSISNVNSILGSIGEPQPIIYANSGLKVQFFEKEGAGTVESIQLNENGGFDPIRLKLTNNNATLPITVTGVAADKASIESADGTVIAVNGSTDLDITAPAGFNETGIITYTITYKVGSDATGYLMDEGGKAVEFTTKAYIYVKDKAFTPYHFMDEKTALNGVSKWDHFVEATKYGDFTLISKNSASKFSNKLESGTKWYSFGTAHDTYDYDEDGCQAGCSTTNYKAGDGHAATYGYFIDTSLAPTWQDAGFRLRIAETKESTYQNAPLKTIRVANDQAFLNGIKGDDKTFTLTFYPSATGTQDKTWAITSTGTLEVATYANPDEGKQLLFGEHKNNNKFVENTVLALMTGEIPSGVTEAKFMLSPRIEFNGTVLSESVTMTSHIWLTSYDKGELRAAVNEAEAAAYNEKYFTADSWSAYQQALKAAKEVLGKAETTQSEVDSAAAALESAYKGLKRYEYVLTHKDIIHENADKKSEATTTNTNYYLLVGNSTFTVPQDGDAIALGTINKYDDVKTLTITDTAESEYHYWYIDYTDAKTVLENAEEILKNADEYGADYIENLQKATDELQGIIDTETVTATPEEQFEVNELIKAVTDITGHEHNYEKKVTEPTCTQGGYTTYTCSMCGTWYISDLTDASGHKWGNWIYVGNGEHQRVCANDNNHIETEACADSGEDTNCNCDECGELVKHTEGEAVVEDKIDATCGKDGSYNSVVYCSVCNEKLSSTTVVIPATGNHSYGSFNHVENTTTHAKVCSVCGNTVTENCTAGEWIVDKNATCVEEGSKYTACTVCKTELERKEIPMIAHNFSGDAVDAGDGVHHYACQNLLDAQGTKCGTYGVVINGVHTPGETEACSYGDWQKLDGTYHRHSCKCGNYEDAKHELSDWTVVDGKQTRTCSVCGYLESVNVYTVTWVDGDGNVIETDENVPVGATPHYDGETPTKAATAQYTYTFKGWDKEFVAVTGDVTYTAEFDSTVNKYKVTFKKFGGEEISAQYDYGTLSSELSVPANTANDYDGNSHYSYSWPSLGNVTGDVTYEEIRNGENHSYTVHNDKDDKYHTDVCDCGYSKDVEHSYDGGVQTTAPTCTDAGVKTYTCSVCKGTKTEAIEKLGHDYKATVTDPTCTEDGYTTHTCSRCQDSYKDSETSALGHKYGETWTPSEESSKHYRDCTVCGDKGRETVSCTESEWIIRVNATCMEEGSQYKKCTVCGQELKSEVIPKTEHKFDGDISNSRDGYHVYKCTNLLNTGSYCTETGAEEKCSGGVATCIAKAKCEKCHVEYGTINADNHTNLIKTDAVKNTCEADGNIEYWTCEGCKKLYKDENATDETNADDVVIAKKGHKDENKDHACDNGCDKYQGVHEDTNLDHICDYGCQVKIGEHKDNDKNHTCDYGCSESIGVCEDTDRDHDCDYGCDKTYGKHEDSDKNHICDYGCQVKIGEHKDNDKNHTCDYGCSESIGVCEDTDRDHDCDYGCDKTYGKHEDNDKNHTCDYGCQVKLGEHKDSADDNDHICDYCKNAEDILENCTESDWITDIPATCEGKGSKYKKCTVCGKELEREEIPAIKHDYDRTKSEENLTRPVLTDGVWSQGYYTYTCKNDASHKEKEFVDRASYADYESARNSLEGLLATDITDEAKSAIKEILDANDIRDDLIASEQKILDDAKELFENTLDQYKGSLKTYIVTFVIDGKESKVTVVSGNDATAPTDVKKAYDDTYHYVFTGWDETFTNVTSDMTVTAQFDEIAHTYTHTDKNDEYHIDACSCGYSKDVKHTETSAVTKKATCEADGVRTYTCSVCNGTRTKAIEKRAHVYEDNGVKTPATCMAEGVMNTICTNEETETHEACKHESTRVIPVDVNAHKYMAATYSWTQNADGKWNCTAVSECEHNSEHTLTAIATAESAVKNPATCEGKGTTTYTASFGVDWAKDQTQDVVDIPALGHKDDNKDHKCDNGCNVYQGAHEDKNFDHVCDYGCSESIGECVDNDKDHKCDHGCGADFGTHEDKNKDHICDYGCKVSLGEHKDSSNDNDHICDYCKNAEEILEKCSDADDDGNHTCDVCGKAEITDHEYGAADCEKPATCAECGAETGTALGHSFTKYESDGNATCLGNGTETAKCDRCDATDTREDDESALGHSFTNYKSNEDATCQNNGTETAKCDRCDATDTREIADSTVGHKFESYVANGDATCQKNETETAECAFGCGEKDTREIADSTVDHKFEKYVANKDATCQKNETETAECAFGCGEKDTREIADSTVGHKFENYVANKDATCQKNETETAECAFGCGEKNTREIADSTVGHKFESYVANKDATCQKNETETAECAFGCGEKDTREIADSTVGHKFTVYTSDNNAECEKDGTKTAVCDYGCGNKDTVTDTGSALDHSWKEATYSFAEDGSSCTATRVCGRDASHVETSTAKMITSAVKTKATCKEMGTTTYTATFAETWAETQTKDVKDIPLADHSYKDATCDKPSTCTVCGVTSGTAVGHLWSDTTYNWFETKEGWSCTAERVCQRTDCGVKTTATVAAELEITKQATCEEKGVETYTANFVSSWTDVQTKTVEIDALGHDYKVTKSVSPNCESAGYKIYTCQNDSGHSYKEVINATEHKYGDYVVVKGATCSMGEVRRRTCSVCGDYKEEVGTQTRPHVISYEPGREPTCLVEGYTAFETCYNCDYHTQSVVIEKLPHEDKDGDGECDRCEGIMTSKGACNCICHKTENKFLNFIYKILRFFWKLFKVQKSCLCGNEHY